MLLRSFSLVVCVPFVGNWCVVYVTISIYRKTKSRRKIRLNLRRLNWARFPLKLSRFAFFVFLSPWHLTPKCHKS